jgi:hypothetical protein
VQPPPPVTGSQLSGALRIPVGCVRDGCPFRNPPTCLAGRLATPATANLVHGPASVLRRGSTQDSYSDTGQIHTPEGVERVRRIYPWGRQCQGTSRYKPSARIVVVGVEEGELILAPVDREEQRRAIAVRLDGQATSGSARNRIRRRPDARLGIGDGLQLEEPCAHSIEDVEGHAVRCILRIGRAHLGGLLGDPRS